MKNTLLLILALVTAQPATGTAEGLYREGSFRPLTSDHRAHRVGDALTVLVLENSSASSSADTSSERSGGMGISIQTPSSDKRAGIALNEDNTGKGRIQRSGRLLAQLTVNVTALAPNGDLIVAGNQLIEVNGEKQSIVLEGRVRPADVSESNTVASSRLADAKISYIGDGLLGERRGPGIIGRVLMLLGIL